MVLSLSTAEGGGSSGEISHQEGAAGLHEPCALDHVCGRRGSSGCWPGVGVQREDLLRPDVLREGQRGVVPLLGASCGRDSGGSSRGSLVRRTGQIQWVQRSDVGLNSESGKKFSMK